jgi:hypothetical protein
VSFTQEQKKFWREWIDALRSGKFPQTSMTLHSQHGYCCLGVGCEIKGEGEWNGDFDYAIQVGEDIDIWSSEPNWSVYESWLGLEEGLKFTHPLHSDNPLEYSEGHWMPDGFVNICMTLNDDAEWTFDEIAGWVEQVATEQGVFDD